MRYTKTILVFMKKLRAVLPVILTCFSFFVVIAEVFAQTGGTGGTTIPINNPLGTTNLVTIMNGIINGLIKLAVPVVSAMVLFAGFQFLTAGGNPQKITSGRNTLLWAAVGFAIILLAASIASIVSNLVGGPTLSGAKSLSDFVNIFCLIAGWMFSFLAIATIIFVILAGYNYLTAAGNPAQLTKANYMLIYAAIALAVGLLARSFPLIIAELVGGTFTACP